MGQLGIFDLSRRYEGLDVKDDPLVAIAAIPSRLARLAAMCRRRSRAPIGRGLSPGRRRRSPCADWWPNLPDAGCGSTTRTVWTFIRREGLSFKKNRAGERAKPSRRRLQARAVEDPPGPH